MTFEGKKVEGKFKEDSIWNWTLKGQLDGHTLKVTWEADHWFQEHKGAGYLVFAADARAFEGVLQGTPKPPRARIVEGTKVG